MAARRQSPPVVSDSSDGHSSGGMLLHRLENARKLDHTKNPGYQAPTANIARYCCGVPSLGSLLCVRVLRGVARFVTLALRSHPNSFVHLFRITNHRDGRHPCSRIKCWDGEIIACMECGDIRTAVWLHLCDIWLYCYFECCGHITSFSTSWLDSFHLRRGGFRMLSNGV